MEESDKMNTQSDAEKMSKADSAACGCTTAIILVMLGFLFLYLMSLVPMKPTPSAERHKMQVEAVEKGFARWKVDTNGRTEFEWIEKE
jgi:hypothetical protein